MKRLVRWPWSFRRARYPHLSSLTKIQGWISIDEANLLYDLASQVSDGCIVEVGSYHGKSTIALALGANSGYGAKVYAIEPHETFHGLLGGEFGPQDRSAFFRHMLQTGCYCNVRLINLSSEIVSPGWVERVALLWIDGDHSLKGVRRDLECWLPHLTDRALIAFDDSLNPNLGPFKVINDLTEQGFILMRQVGKITVLQRT